MDGRHGETSATVEKIVSKKWDIVILQEATVCLLIPEESAYWYEPAVLKLDSVIKSKKAHTLLYQNYSLSDCPTRYCAPSQAIEFMMAGLSDKKIHFDKKSCCSDSFQTSDREFIAIAKETKHIA